MLFLGDAIPVSVCGGPCYDSTPSLGGQFAPSVGLCPNTPESGRPPQPAVQHSKVGKGKEGLEGRTLQERIRVKKQMGSLKNFTRQPRTRARYDKAKQRF